MLNFRLENLKNKRGINILRSPYFFVLAVILAVTCGLLFLSNFSTFKSDISILIIPKNESASFQVDQIMENLTDITHRLSFYDRVLYDNSEIKDPFMALSKDQRKEHWNKSFAVQRLPNSTTLNISVFNADRAEANKIARQVALTLSEVASRFYNIQTELEFRIIEGPISSSFVRSWQWLVLSSIFTGIIVAFLILFLFNLFSLNFIKRRMNSGFAWDKLQSTVKSQAGQAIGSGKNIPRKDFFAPTGDLLKEYLAEADFAVSATKKAEAPVNLPIAQEDVPNAVHEPSIEVLAAALPPSEEEKGEPTDEEYRERLNKLLRGEI